ncbi:MAG: AAA family ATPase [Magnetococcales bacterium]|nr:AAA family ATPase [Magnetococcales bacterium]MBF0114274.1 AAA family ATPase [Magnetococcales bacterium]
MAVYAFWNNKGGVGKSYLTFQVACEYARTHPDRKVLVIDLCPQANASGMILGGISAGEVAINHLAHRTGQRQPMTISGYLDDRIVSPYKNPYSGANYVTQVKKFNAAAPENIYIACGDSSLELQSEQVRNACLPGPPEAWRIVHTWVRDLIEDMKTFWNEQDLTVFIDCNPSFTIYTEIALCAAERLIIPFSSDGSSKRAVKSVLSLVYGVQNGAGQAVSAFYTSTNRFRMKLPQIYAYVGNRLTQMNNSSASAFKQVVVGIFNEVYDVWRNNPDIFKIHPNGASAPTGRPAFRSMFESQINDANTASVVSGALGIPICSLTAGRKDLSGKEVIVNQSQLEKQQPNIREFVASIE